MENIIIIRYNNIAIVALLLSFDCVIVFDCNNKVRFNGIMSAGSKNNSFEQDSPTSLSPDNKTFQIKDVWANNLEEEFKVIRVVVQKYNWIAMDTEFPGVVARPVGEFRDSNDFQYRMLKCNVDLLRIIQLGITFFDDKGNPPIDCNSTWQFNFKFEINKDMYAQESIMLLQNSGIQFQKHYTDGINPLHFAELLMTSGLVLIDNVKWLSFHSGYDFGYLLKVLTNNELPIDVNEFYDLLKLFFPTIYDIKYLIRNCQFLGGGLQDVAEQLSISRIGQQHQAGSDSLLTGMLFFKMKELFFEGIIDKSKFNGILYGLAPSEFNDSF